MCLEVAVLLPSVFSKCLPITGTFLRQGVCRGGPIAEALHNSRGRQGIVRGGGVANSKETGWRVVLE